MAIKDLKKSTGFVLSLLGVLLILLPFGIEQVADTFGFDFSATRWITSLFKFKGSKGTPNTIAKVQWDKQIKDIEEFSKWTEGLAEVRISIVRPEEFQIVRARQTTGYEAKFSWKLLLLSDTLTSNATQVRDSLTLICEPEGEVEGEIDSVVPLSGGEKGYLVTAKKVGGKGKMGLSYKSLPPCYYDVKLRMMWLVPVASCRSAMKGRYESAVFFPGVERGLPEGAVISPSSDKCGYRILSISDHCVWLEAFYTDRPEEETMPRSIWPDFSRVDTLPPTPPPGRLIFGRNRCFWPGDAIQLPNSGIYLYVDNFLAGRAAVFRLLGPTMRPICDLLCVIVREK